MANALFSFNRTFLAPLLALAASLALPGRAAAGESGLGGQTFAAFREAPANAAALDRWLTDAEPGAPGAAPAALRLQVTGERTPRAYFGPAAAREIERHLFALDGVAWGVDADRIVAPPEVEQGRSVEAFVPIHFWEPGLPLQVKICRVTVENRVVERRAPSEVLYVSNSPEQLNGPGLLQSADIRRGGSARFLAHHANGAERPLFFHVALENPTASATVVQIIEGDGEVGRDELAAGHISARLFLKRLNANVGRIIELAPGAVFDLRMERMEPGQIFSSIFEERVLSGDGVKVFIQALDRESMGRRLAEKFQGRDARRSHGRFEGALVRKTQKYVIGQPWSFIGVGDAPLAGRNDEAEETLRGNYGVLYDLNVIVENPFDQARRAHILFNPSAGAAKGSFIVDGVWREAGYYKSPEESELAWFEIPPGKRRSIRILTMPQSGSNYPVRLVVKDRSISYR